jgi:type III restriction enzyme
VVLFKAKTIAESKSFADEFVSRIAKLSAKDIDRLSRLVDNPTLNAAFAYFKKCGLSAADLAQELKLDFAKEHCISANDDKEAAARQIALNSLEDADNPYRAVFEVKKLDEGWDVLNLFDIVRLYETRQSGGKSISPTTIAEAQLIGRGSRYCPFVVKTGQEKFQRKYDNDGANPLRICEELYYHCQIDPRYIAELKSALRQIGAESDPERCEYRLKERFKNDELYKAGVVFVNEQREKSRKGVTGIPQSVRNGTIEYKTNLGSSREGAVMEDSGTKEDI